MTAGVWLVPDGMDGRPAWRRSFEARGLIPSRNEDGVVDRYQVARWLGTVIVGVTLAAALYYLVG